ncbi:hypothetical protein EON65_36645 [archaeon]|nr:MAG: hypothetical protein EON65_36645 [archaeon]
MENFSLPTAVHFLQTFRNDLPDKDSRLSLVDKGLIPLMELDQSDVGEAGPPYDALARTIQENEVMEAICRYASPDHDGYTSSLHGRND